MFVDGLILFGEMMFFQSLLPRGQYPNALREKLQQVNELLKDSLENLPKIELVVIDKGFVQPDGKYLEAHNKVLT